MNLNDQMGQFRTVRGNDQIHPTPAAVPTQKFSLGHMNRRAHTGEGIPIKLMTTGAVGFSKANPVNFSMTPVSKIIISTPETKQTAHIKIGGNCK
jgi:hypothetical protein